jgi:hypothetical protein
VAGERPATAAHADVASIDAWGCSQLERVTGRDYVSRVSKLLVAAAVGAAALALYAAILRPPPEAPVVQSPAPGAAPRSASRWNKAEAAAEQIFGHLAYTPEQSAALQQAGFAIYDGKRPTDNLSAASLEQLRGVSAMFQAIACTAGPCTRYPRDFVACMDDAAALIRLHRDRVPIDRNVYIAAMGVSVVTREIPYQTPPQLAEFCRKFIAAHRQFRATPPAG